MLRTAKKVVLVYSDKRGAQLVAEACERLQLQCSSPGECIQSTWRVELLRSQKLRLIAGREAAEADVIVVATREGSPIRDELAEWLKLSRNDRHASRATLVALLQRDNLESSRPVEEMLLAFAESCGMDFVCHSRVERPDRWAPVAGPFLASEKWPTD